MVAAVDRGSARGPGWSGGVFLAWSNGAGPTLLHRRVGDSDRHTGDSGGDKAQAGDRGGVGARVERSSICALRGATGCNTSTRRSALTGVADRSLRARLRRVGAGTRLPAAQPRRRPAHRGELNGSMEEGRFLL